MRKLHAIIFSILFLNFIFNLSLHGQNYRQPKLALDTIQFFWLKNKLKVGVAPDSTSVRIAFKLNFGPYGHVAQEKQGYVVDYLINRPLGKFNASLKDISANLAFQVLHGPSYIACFGDSTQQDTILTLLGLTMDSIRYDSALMANIIQKDQSIAIPQTMEKAEITNQFSQWALHDIQPGAKDSIKIDSMEFFSIIKKVLRPDNANLVSVGGIRISQIKKQMDSKLKRWVADSTSSPAKPLIKRNTPIWGERWYVHDSGVSEPFMQYLLPLKLSDTLNQELVFWMLEKYLGGHPSSALNESFRVQKGMTNGFLAKYIKQDSISYLLIQGGVLNDNIGSVIEELGILLENLKYDPIDTYEIDRAGNMATLQFLRNSERLDFVCDLVQYAIEKPLPGNYFRDIEEKIQQLTPQQVLKTATRYIASDSAFVIFTGDLFKNGLIRLIPAKQENIRVFDANYNAIDLKTFPSTANMTVDSIFDRYLTTVSEDLELDSINSISATWEADFSETPVILHSKVNKALQGYAMEINMGGLTISDIKLLKDTARVYEAGKYADITDVKILDQLRLQTQIFPEKQFPNSGWTFNLLDVQYEQGEPVYCIECGINDTQFTNCYSVKSGLKVVFSSLTNIDGQQREFKQYFRGYSSREGILFPTEVEIFGITPVPLIFKLTDLKINPELTEAQFRKEKKSY